MTRTQSAKTMFGRILTKLIITAGIVIGISLIAFLSLPFLINAFFLPPLLEKTVFSTPGASISRITPYSVSGTVDLEQQGRPSIAIPRFSLRFSPRNLLQRKIESLELAHGVFHIYREDDRWLFPGAGNERQAQPDTSNSRQLFLLPLGVDQLLLKQCRIIIHDHSGREVHIGINARIEPEFVKREKKHLLESISGSLQLFDDIAAHVLFAVSAVSEHDDSLDVELTVDNGNLFLADGILPEALDPFTFSSLSARLNLVLDSETFEPAHYNLNGKVAEMRYQVDQVDIGTGRRDEGVTFALSGTGQEHSYEISSVIMNSPVEAEIGARGTVSYKDEALTSKGAVNAFLHSGKEGTDESGSVNIPLALHYDGSWSQQSGYRLTAGGDFRSSQPLKPLANLTIMGLDDLRFSGSFSGDAHRSQAHLKLNSAPLTLTYDSQEIQTSPVGLTAAASRTDEDIQLQVSGSLTSVELPDAEIRLEDIRFSLPYVSDALTPSSSGAIPAGRFEIGSLLMSGEHLAGLTTEITLQDAPQSPVYTARGSLKGQFNPDLHISFDAEALPLNGSGWIDWQFAPTAITPESLPGLVALPIDLDFSGIVAASGRVDMNDFTVSASVAASLNDTSMEFSDSGLSIEALHCAVEFPELPRIASSPSQVCSTGAIDLASLHFDDAELIFRVENSQSLFIEKSSLSWCAGTLGSGSVRLTPDITEIDTTLYCNRINLGSLLEQFGFSGTEGEGSLNGALPIRLSENSLEFNNGFLFSTPGTGGIVRFTDTELLRQGMGAVSETGYISYSLAALEDFTYNWTKLSFDSSAEDLLLTLELDGKPTTPLPFKFDRKGMIVENNKGEGLQYPIRLDVNFRLPLTELFQIGQSINSLMGNSQ